MSFDGLDLKDNRWKRLLGGYRIPYDPRPRWLRSNAAATSPMPGTKSELARDDARNPKLPADFQKSYETAWTRLVEIGLRELKAAASETLVTSIIAVAAITKGQRTLGRFAIEFTEDERRQMLATAGWL